MNEVIVTGFAPFGGRAHNRSWDVVSALAARPGLVRVQLPVDFAALAPAIRALIKRDPLALIMVGEDLREDVAIERIALNVAHARIPDNVGAAPQLAPLVPGAPLAVQATWDTPRVLAAVQRAGVPSVISHHAGTFACNAALFHALHAATGGPQVAVGFVHVPVAGPLSDAQLVAALEAAIVAST